MSSFYNRSPVLKRSNLYLFVPRKFSTLKTWAPRCRSTPAEFPVLTYAQAVVSRPLDCSLCRECIRPPGWEQRVQLSRVKDEFLFTIESTGILSPEELFKEALKVGNCSKDMRLRRWCWCLWRYILSWIRKRQREIERQHTQRFACWYVILLNIVSNDLCKRPGSPWSPIIVYVLPEPVTPHVNNIPRIHL